MKLIKIIIIIITLLPIILKSQKLEFQKIDGNITQYQFDEIDSLTFSSPDSSFGDNSSCPGIATVSYEGKTYNTVQIENQCWLKENLDVGTMVWSNKVQDDNGIIEKYCYYNEEKYCNIFGGLYSWNEMMQYSKIEGAQGICPEAWHIPTYDEYQTLFNAVDNNSYALFAKYQWSSGIGTNKSGFTALLTGGLVKGNGGESFQFLDNANIWSSTLDSSSDLPGLLHIESWGDYIHFFATWSWSTYFSVRCIKD